MLKPEILGRNGQGVESEKPTVENINYTAILERLGLKEEEVTPDVIVRLKEHFSLYTNGVEANIALLEEKTNTNEFNQVAKIEALENWMRTEKVRVQKKGGTDAVDIQDNKNVLHDTVQNTTDTAQAGLQKEIETKIQSSPLLGNLAKIPYIGESIVSWLSSGLMDYAKEYHSASGFSFGKLIFGMIASAVGVKEILERVNVEVPVVNTLEVKPTEVPAIESPLEENPDQTSPETISSIKYSTGFGLLVSLSGIKIDKNIGRGEIKDGLAEIPYGDFLEKRNDMDFRNQVLGEGKENSEIVDQYGKISDALGSHNTKELLRIGCSLDMVSTILLGRNGNKENTSLKESFGDARFQEIIEMIKDGSYNYQKLSFKELCLLYVATIPALSGGAILALGAGIKDVAGGVIDGYDTIAGSLQEKGRFSQYFLGKLTMFDGKHEVLNTSKDSMIEKLELSSAEDTESFGELYEFTTYLRSPEFLGNTKLQLSPEQRTLFEGHLDYKKALILFTIMGGNHLEDLNPVNLILIVGTMYKFMVLGGTVTDNMTAANWIANFAKQGLSTNSEVFTPDEKIVLGIYARKIADMAIYSHLSWMAGMIGVTGIDKNHLPEYAIASGVSGLALRTIGVRMTSNALKAGRMPFLGTWAKRAGWIGMGAGVFLGGLSLLDSDESGISARDTDLQNAYGDGTNPDMAKILEILEKSRDSITQYTNSLNEKINVVAYGNESPYVVIAGKVYVVGVIDKTRSLADAGLVAYAQGMAVDTVTLGQAQRNMTLGGQGLEGVKIENGRIILGDNVWSIGIQESINSWTPRHIDEDLLQKAGTLFQEAGNGATGILQGLGMLDNYSIPEDQRDGDYILKIADIDDTLMLGLVPVGEIGEVDLDTTQTQ